MFHVKHLYVFARMQRKGASCIPHRMRPICRAVWRCVLRAPRGCDRARGALVRYHGCSNERTRMFHVKHLYAMGRARTMTKKLLMGNEAFAHAALEAGVRVVAGYPGTPSSELIETVAKLHDDGAARGIHVEWSTNEKSALELLAGASYTGARCLFTCKQVGLNVASDALMSLNYVGVKGGMVLFVADDPGPISSQTEQDTRRFASFAKLPVLDPATPDQGFAMMQAAFDLSERYHTPVIVRPTTRINHASTFFDVADATDARPVPDEGFERDPKWVIFPRRAYQAHGEINERLAAIAHDFAVEPALAAFNPMVEGSRPRMHERMFHVKHSTTGACRRRRRVRAPRRWGSARARRSLQLPQSRRASASWRAACRPPMRARRCAWWKRARRQRAWKCPRTGSGRWERPTRSRRSWPRRSRKASTKCSFWKSWTTCWRMRCSCMLVARMRPTKCAAV